ncbi:MAG: sugar transferase [Bacteroidota bacterium]|nr:sugar transferase [Bacteroidota bacterium]
MGLLKVLHKLKIIPFLEKWKILNIIFGFLDILAITLAFQLAYSIEFGTWKNIFTENRTLLYIYVGIMPVWLIILYFIKIAEIPRTKRYRILFYEYLQATFFIGLLFILIYFLFRMYMVPRSLLVNICLIGFILLFTVRLFEYKVFKIYRSRGYNQRNIVIIADETALPFIKSLQTYPEWGYHIQTIFTESEKVFNELEDTIITLPGMFLRDLHQLIEVDHIDEVLYYKNNLVPQEVRDIIRSCEELGVTLRVHIEKSDANITNAARTTLGREQFLTFSNIPYKTISLAAKRFMDVLVSLIMIVLFFPFMIFAAVAIKFSSPGPVIFKQERVGLRGRRFNMYKFRTMVANAESMKEDLEEQNVADKPAFKIEDDPRVTKIGKFLRRTGLDELPQLFNILKGEMSLIGPRPPLRSETIQYKRWQLRRLSVKPGLSCFWQIKPHRYFIKFEKWMEMDLAYIDNWSFRMDLLILLQTVRTFFKRILQ